MTHGGLRESCFGVEEGKAIDTATHTPSLDKQIVSIEISLDSLGGSIDSSVCRIESVVSSANPSV